MHNENWDDLRFVLTVVETGSVLRAAKELGVNHATVLRRVGAFEERYGVPVFERTAQGYRLLPDRAHLIRAAQDAQAAMAEVGRLAGGGRHATSGEMRIASTDAFCSVILPEFVAELSKDQDFLVTLLSSNMHLDVLREQAHVVVRPALKLPEDLVGVKACDIGFTAFATDDGARDWLTMTGPISRSVAARWIADEVPPDQLRTASDSFLSLRELAVLEGSIAVLPSFLGDRDPRLHRIKTPMPRLSMPLWIAHHVDTVASVHMKLVRERLLAFFAARKAEMSG